MQTLSTPNEWKTAALSAGEVQYYSFYATAGQTYRLIWDDSKDGNKTKTADIRVTAYDETPTFFFTAQDSGYSSHPSVTPKVSGNIIIKVEGYSAGVSGTYAITYQ